MRIRADWQCQLLINRVVVDVNDVWSITVTTHSAIDMLQITTAAFL